MDKIELGTPFRTVIIKILSCNPKMLSVFGRTKEKDLFFKDLLTIGCDFYELLELFANCEAINNESINCIVENVPNVEIIENYNDKEIRRMIPHWSSSKYHTATIKDICQELKMHIESDSKVHLYITVIIQKIRKSIMTHIFFLYQIQINSFLI